MSNKNITVKKKRSKTKQLDDIIKLQEGGAINFSSMKTAEQIQQIKIKTLQNINKFEDINTITKEQYDQFTEKQKKAITNEIKVQLVRKFIVDKKAAAAARMLCPPALYSRRPSAL